MRVIFLVAVFMGLGIATTAAAQPTQRGCFPACRPGFFCVEAECVSMCSPTCAPGSVCTPQGRCVSACNPECPPGNVCTPEGQCVSACNPPCAPGSVCTPGGQCVSACNPACAPGQTCTAAGSCAGPPPVGPGPGGPAPAWGPGSATGGAPPAWGAGTQSAGPTLAWQSGPVGYQGVGTSGGGPGWARTAGVLGIVTALGLTGLTAATVATNGEPDVNIPLGISATVFGAVLIPIVAMGASSARDGSGASGSPGLRLAAWITYALALADAVVLIGLSIAGAEIDGAVTASVGVLGLLSDLGMTIDAYNSASDAEAVAPPMAGGIGLFVAPAGIALSGMVVGVAGTL